MADLIQFDEGSGRRIARVVRTVEGMGPRAKPLVFDAIAEMFRRGGGTTTSSPLRLCKTVGAWAKGTSAVVEIWEDCDCGAEGVSRDTAGNKLTLTAWNKYANIPGDRFCSVALHGNGCYYVVSAECA